VECVELLRLNSLRRKIETADSSEIVSLGRASAGCPWAQGAECAPPTRAQRP
jgi:hypothetical protein